jgi:4,5-DOPA dioxygenase extradiol
MPTLFVSHGSPMHAINAGAAGQAWAAVARDVPAPRAILIATAHWETNVPTFSASPTPPMIYDFGGFPEALYKIIYRAQGNPALAAKGVALLEKAGIAARVDTGRGFDHGTWVPLLKMFPEANIPVVQLSVQPAMSPLAHFRVGQALASLADDDVLIVGSGHLTHNLRDWMMSRQSAERLPYATAFQQWVNTQLLENNLEALSQYRELVPEGVRAHPSPEHFLPLFVAWGAASGGADKPTVERVFDGFEGSALAMDAYRFSAAA